MKVHEHRLLLTCLVVEIQVDEKLHMSVRNYKRCDGIVGAYLLVLLLAGTGSTKRVCRIHYMTRFCNLYLLVTLHFAGMRIYSGKSGIVKSWNTIRGR